jgi:predicted HAD superfamily hydrolase
MRYSFDVFDTVLTRTWANPTDLFWELGNQLRQCNLISVSSETFQQYRIEAESRARKISENGEVLLHNIYAQMKSSLSWTEVNVQEAMELEIALEKGSLQVIPIMQEHIQKLRFEGNQISFISDMYLSSKAIQDFLAHNQIWSEGDDLYVSGDLGVNKASGQLFTHFLTKKGIISSELTHTGDNGHADIKMAQSFGIQTQEFKAAHLNRYEQAIFAKENLPLKFRSLLAGASRLTRLHNPESTPHHKVIWDTATSVIAPVLFGYIHWCLQEAQKRGIQRLYFVARDGQILHKIAQVICQKWNYDIDCRYFYGSRLAFHVPAIDQIGEQELEWIFNREPNADISSFFAKVHCDPAEFSQFLTANGFPEAGWSKVLDKEEQDRLKKLFQQAPIADTVIANAASYREKAIAYFRQEGMGDGSTFALADIGWSGKSQTSFSKLLQVGGMYPEQGICGLYFGLQFPVKPFQQDTATGYFFYPDASVERNSLIYRELLELFVYADHPSTTAYDVVDGVYGPVFREKVSHAALEWGIETQQNAIVKFAECLTDVLTPEDCASDYFHQISDNLLRLFIHNPSAEEAEAYGSFKFSPNIMEDFFFEFARVYQNKDLLPLLTQLRKGKTYAAWLPASIQRSSPSVRPLMKVAMASQNSREYLVFANTSSKNRDFRLTASYLWKAVKTYPAIVTKKHFLWVSRDALFSYIAHK